MLQPRTEALAYRIWWHAQAAGWDLTLYDLAELTGESWHRVRAVCQRKNWLSRLRVQTPQSDPRHTFFSGEAVRDEQSALRQIGGAAW